MNTQTNTVEHDHALMYRCGTACPVVIERERAEREAPVADTMEEVGAVELTDGGHLVVSLTATGVQLQREPGDAEPLDLDLHHARWLRNLLDRAIEKASKEGL